MVIQGMFKFSSVPFISCLLCFPMSDEEPSSCAADRQEMTPNECFGRAGKQPGHRNFRALPENTAASAGEGFITVNTIPDVAHQSSNVENHFLLLCCRRVRLNPEKAFVPQVVTPKRTRFLALSEKRDHS